MNTSSFSKKYGHSAGVSLIETLIYAAILIIIVVVIVNLLTIILRVRVQSEAEVEIEQNLRYALDKITQDIKSATAVTGTYPADTLNLTIAGSTVTYSLSAGVLQRTESLVASDITTNKVIASAGNGNIFTKISQPPPAKTAVQIKLKVMYNSTNPYTSGLQSIGQTTVSLRQ